MATLSCLIFRLPGCLDWEPCEFSPTFCEDILPYGPLPKDFDNLVVCHLFTGVAFLLHSKHHYLIQTSTACLEMDWIWQNFMKPNGQNQTSRHFSFFYKPHVLEMLPPPFLHLMSNAFVTPKNLPTKLLVE